MMVHWGQTALIKVYMNMKMIVNVKSFISKLNIYGISGSEWCFGTQPTWSQWHIWGNIINKQLRIHFPFLSLRSLPLSSNSQDSLSSASRTTRSLMRSRPENWSLRFLFSFIPRDKLNSETFTRLLPRRPGRGDSLPVLMWLSTFSTWMTMPPCLTGTSTGEHNGIPVSSINRKTQICC